MFRKRWIYFLEHADSLNAIPLAFKEFPLVNEAFTVIEQRNWSKKEVEEYDVSLNSIRSNASILDTMRQEAEARGKKLKAIAIAKNLYAAGVAQEIIIKTTGLTKDECEKLSLLTLDL